MCTKTQERSNTHKQAHICEVRCGDDLIRFSALDVDVLQYSLALANQTSCARGDSICLRPLQVDNT